MTELLIQATPFMEIAMLKLKTATARVVSALDAFATAKARNAIPDWRLRKVQREINRCRRLILSPAHGEGLPCHRK